jgi:hypothetical protein
MSSSTQPASSTQLAFGGGPISLVPTLKAYPVLESLYQTLKPFLSLEELLPTDAGMRESLALQILYKLDVLVSLPQFFLLESSLQILTFLYLLDGRVYGPTGGSKQRPPRLSSRAFFRSRSTST